MKTISLISRRDDLSLSAFQRYYEDSHCWLAMKHFPFTCYTRNHLNAGSVDLDFDCVSQFGMDPDFDGDGVMNSHSRAMMLEEELNFMKPERIRVASVREQTLVAADDASMLAACQRYMLLFQCACSDQAGFQAEVEVAAKELTAESVGIHHASLDLVVAKVGEKFPFDALLWLTMAEGSDAQLPQRNELPGLVAVVAVSTHATPEATLRRRFEAYLP